MIQTSRRDLAIASICAAAAIQLAASSAAATAIPPPEDGIDLTPHPAPTAVIPDGCGTAETGPLSASEQRADPSPSAPRIVRVERSWIETWAVGEGVWPAGAALPSNRWNQAASKAFKSAGEGVAGRLGFLCKHGERFWMRRCGEARPEVGMILRGAEALIYLYERQSSLTDAEELPEGRIDVCDKIIGLRMVSEFQASGTAIRECCGDAARRGRALVRNIRETEKEIDRFQLEKAEVEEHIRRLGEKRAILKRKIDELRERREHQAAELHGIRQQMETRNSGESESCARADDSEPPANPQANKTKRKALQTLSLRLLAALLH